MRFRLLGCLANALAKHGVKFLCGLVPGGDVLFDIASDVWEDYRRGGQEDLRGEIGELAQALAAEVQQEARDAAAAAAPHLSDDEQQKIAAYLGQVPGMIRRSLRRPSDPTGTTVPATLSLRSPEDLLPFLPPGPPRFQAGMRPLPGVDWVLEEPLGVGGFGEVWKARHAHLKSKPPVALKFCLDPSAAAVLRNEAGVLDRLMQHGRRPGVVPLLDAYLTADPPCLVYEYVEGGDLTGLIRELHAAGRPAPDAVSRLLLKLAEIVASVHRAEPAIVHDDLKPSNILVRRGAGRELELNVADFGIGGLAVARAARQTRQPTYTREQLLTEAVRGAYTPLYASPEQMARRRDQPADPRDDVHALGVIWYQLATGDLEMLRLPSDWREEVRQHGLSENLTGLLASCLASKAEKRPADAGVLAERLREELNPRRSASSPVTPPGRDLPPVTPRRRAPSSRGAVWTALIFLMLTAAVIAGAVWMNRPRSTTPDSRASVGNTFVPVPANSAPPKSQPVSNPVIAAPPKSQPVSNPVAAAPPLGKDYTNSIGMKFKWIEPGRFLMGSPDGKTPPGVPAEKGRQEDETPHYVTLTKGFYMGVYPVTKRQFAAFVQAIGYQTDAEKNSDPETWKNPDFRGYTQTDEDPVVDVSWNDGVQLCDWLSKKEKKTYQMPTEAQWEYACRAGTGTAYSFGDDARNLGEYAWWDGNSGYHTHPVGGKKPNLWGLYDMNGNVWQSCQDGCDAYPTSDVTDPVEMVKGSVHIHAQRGGSWIDAGYSICRAAYRGRTDPSNRNSLIGLRICFRLD